MEPADLLRRAHKPNGYPKAERPPPSPSTPGPWTTTRPASYAVHRGQEIRRTLTRVEREITLLDLINRGLVKMTPKGAALNDSTLDAGDLRSE